MSKQKAGPRVADTGKYRSAHNSTDTRDPVQELLSRLSGVKKTGPNRWEATCPAHDDKTPSLSVSVGRNGAALVTCHAGCSLEVVTAAIDLEPRDLFPPKPNELRSARISATYDYVNAAGELLYQVVRYDPKDFRQRRPDGHGGWLWNLRGVRRIMYRLQGLLEADPRTWCCLVEGEQDADRLVTRGFLATTSSGGAGKFHLTDTTPLHGRRVALFWDRDEAGERHRDHVAQALHGKAAELHIVELPEPYHDVSDYVRDNHSTADIQSLIDAAPIYEPTAQDEPGATPESWTATACKAEPLTRETLGTTDEWTEPIPFGVHNVPKFPLEAIPTRLGEFRTFCEAASESIQVPADAVTLLALAVGGAALAKRIEVKVKSDWPPEATNLFMVVTMPSGERKSALFRLVTVPLVDFEREENERLAPLVEKNCTERLLLDAELKQARHAAVQAKKPDAKRQARERVDELAEQLRTTEVLVPLQLVADDATPEAVSRLLAEQCGRVALLSPEGDIFDLMAGRYSDGVSRLGVYLKGHAGDDIRVNRIGRTTEYVRNPALTVGLAVQPSVLVGLLEKPQLRGRGLLARFLYSLPASRVGYRELEPPPIPDSAAAAYARLIRAALQLQPVTDANGELCPHVVRLSSDAHTELNHFRESVEHELRDCGELAALRDWGSKLPGAACRIAGVFHGLMHAPKGNPASEPIDSETMLGAIALGKYFTEHAKAAFGLMGSDAATAVARRLLDWLRDTGLTGYSRRDAHRATGVERVAALDEPHRLLAEHGYIREQLTSRKGPGRKPSIRYEVNPLWRRQN